MPHKILLIWPSMSLQEGISILSSQVISRVPYCFDIHQWLWSIQLKVIAVKFPLSSGCVVNRNTMQKNMKPLQQIFIACRKFYEMNCCVLIPIWLCVDPNLKAAPFFCHSLLSTPPGWPGPVQVMLPKGAQTSPSCSASHQALTALPQLLPLLYHNLLSSTHLSSSPTPEDSVSSTEK